MDIEKGFAPILILILILIIGGVYFFYSPRAKNIIQTVPPSPTSYQFPYKIPQIPNKRSYLTFLVGDSIVAALGANDEGLREDLLKLYPNHEFVNYNYGFPSTNIESLPDRINLTSTSLGTNYQSINSQGFDLIIIESFAYNPLSQYPVADGVKKQTEILDQGVRELISTHPNAVVAIITPIAPNKEFFAKGVLNLTPAARAQWVAERVAYIKNATDFAQSHNLPLIDVYAKSQTSNGDGDLKYIDPHDYIHPSKAGIILINQTIADFIFNNKIFPQ